MELIVTAQTHHTELGISLASTPVGNRELHLAGNFPVTERVNKVMPTIDISTYGTINAHKVVVMNKSHIAFG
jgi:hypothetical protein